MKNGRKLLSIILTICMVMQILPIFATESEATETTPVAVNLIIDDQFNTKGDTEGETDGWIKGAIKSDGPPFSIDQDTVDEAGVLVLKSGSGTVTNGGDEPNVVKKFAEDQKLSLTNGKPIVIKTKFMRKSGDAFLRFNQPDDTALMSISDIKEIYPNFALEAKHGANAINNWFTLLRADGSGLSYRTSTSDWSNAVLSATDTTNEWVEATIKINSNTDVDITASYAGETKSATDASLVDKFIAPRVAYTLYNSESPETVTEYISAYPSLDSLAWVTGKNAELYVDYIQVYELTPYTATATTAATVDMDKAIEVNFTTEDDVTINEIPAGAVTIAGVEVTESFDAGTLTLTPKANLEPGVTYTVKVDTAKLAELGMTYTGAEKFKVLAKDTSNGSVKMIINDQFNNKGDTEGWVAGAVEADTYKATVVQADGEGADGSGVLKITNTTGDDGTAGRQPNAYKEFAEKIEFDENKKIIIKTRFTHTGNESDSGAGYLKFNQPDNIHLLKTDSYGIPYYWETILGRTDTMPSISKYNALQGWFQLLKFDNTELAYMKKDDQRNWADTTYAEGSTVDKWIEATITINGSENVTISAKIGDTEGDTKAGTLAQDYTAPYAAYTLYDNESATEWITAFTSLDSLTWLTTTTANDILVDYVQVYEVTPYSAYANAVNGSSVEVGKPFEFKFTSTTEGVAPTAIPEGSVTVEGVTVAESYDAETQILSLTPDTALTAGNTYKVTINKAKLAEVGITYTGTTEFNIRARGARSTGVVLNDNFANGTDGWEVGPAQAGFTTTIDSVTADGAKDGKALKITFPAKDETVQLPSNYGTVTKAVGNGIEFKNGKTITFETRLKKTAETTDYYIKINRPNTLEQVGNDYMARAKDEYGKIKAEGIGTYILFGYADSTYPGMLVPSKRLYEDYVPFDDTYRWGTGDGHASGFTATDVWVTYKVVFTPADGNYYITMTYTDENGAEKTVKTDRVAVMKDVKVAIDKEYGVNHYNASEEYNAAYHANNFYKALERLTFTSESGGDLYIDYVKVYEESSVSATVANGGSVEVGSPFELKFTDSNDATAKVAAVPTDAFAVEGVETTNSYDAETQVLSLTPKTALATGTTYKINVDTAKLAEFGMTYTGATQFRVVANNTAATGIRMIVNDQFNTSGDTEGWVAGAVEADTYKATVVQADGEGADGSGVLKITSTGADTAAAGQQPNAYKEFAEKIEFDENKKIIIKTRFTYTGDESNSGAGYLKFNQPNQSALLRGDKWGIPYYWSTTLGRTDTMPAISGTNALDRWFQLLKFDSSNLAYMAKGDQKNWQDTPYAEGSTVDKWIEATITINGSEDITISAKIGNDEGEAKEGTLHQDFTGAYAGYTLYNDKNATAWITAFTSLDSLTWLTTTTANDILVDYIQVYEVELNTAKAQLLNGTKIEEGDAFKLQFMADRAVTEEDVADAVSVTGANVTNTFDAETQTLTLTPDTAVTAGNAYTVTVDKAVLEANGIDYTGTTTFNVKGIKARTAEVGEVYTTDFESGIGTWKAGVANAGYEAVVEPGTDGTNNVLKVTLPAVGDDYNGGNQSLAHFELENGIKFEKDKLVVIKARVKNTTNTPYMIKFNRPDSLTQAENIRQHNGYVLAGQAEKNGVMGLVFGSSSLKTYANGNQFKYVELFDYDADKNAYSFAGVDLTNKWVDWEIILDGTTNKMNVVAKFDDKVLTTFATKNPVNSVPIAQVLNAEYGKGTDIKTFNGLDSISFTSYDTENEGVLYIDDVSVEVIRDRAKLKDVKFTVNGEEVETVKAGDIVIPKYTVDPVISDTYKAITAMYVNGELTQMQVEDIISENTAEETITGEVGFTVPAYGEVVIKAFVWDNLDTFEPLGAAGSVTAAGNDEYLTVYVQAGADGGTGEKNSPVATLNEALTVAAAKKAGGHTDAIKIEMAGGTYKADSTAVVTSANVPDGGLVITKAEGEAPVISGGLKYNVSDAKQVTDATTEGAAILDRLNSDAAKANLYELALGNIEIPALSWPGVPSYGVEELVEKADGITIPELTCEVVFDGELLTNARWPNTGYETAGTVDGNTDEATSENVKDGFTLGCSNTNDWSEAKDALILGYFGNGWSTQTTPLASKSDNTVTSAYASRHGVDATHARYYVYNLLEEIDKPGEYYLDRVNNKLYFYMPESKTENSVISLVTTEQTLLKLDSVSNVTVDGITFENTLGGAAYISSGSNNTIKNCTFRNIFAGHEKAVLDVFTKNALIDNNHIYNTNGGIKVGSDTPKEDSLTLASTNNVISNNHIEKYGLVNKVYVDAIWCMNIGNKILNNEIHDAEHLAMRISGYNHLIQYNEIYDVCQQTEDAGAIYIGKSWTVRGNKILNNYFHDIKTELDTSVSGRNNVAGIFLDDHLADAHIEGNIFADIKGDGIRANRGREHTIHNNLFVNCTRHGVALSGAEVDADKNTTKGTYAEWYDNIESIVLSAESSAEGTLDEATWYAAFPEIFTTQEADWAKPEKFTVTNNIAVNTLGNADSKCVSVGQWIEDLATTEAAPAETGTYGISNNEIRTADPGFANIESDYTIDNAVLQGIVPNFANVQFAKMGRNK